MTPLKKWLTLALIAFGGIVSSSAFTTNDALTIFTAYNNAFLVGGYYSGWWTGAEEIEMAEDAYDNLPTPARQTIVSNACNQFSSHHTTNWISGGGFNEYNDDISWAVIAYARAYRITGNTTFRNIAKFNWDGMYARAWDTNFTGGGLWWRTDNRYKNAAVNGPAAIAACLLYNIYGDSNYLTKAQTIYAWERRVLLNTGSGSIADGINFPNSTTSGGPLTYNQGTFIGAANQLYRATGLPNYYQDAILVGKYTQNSMGSGGILPEYSSNSDLSGFNGIFARWMARFAKDQNLWLSFGPWLTTNANAAWSVRNTNNLAWQKWKTPLGTNIPGDWGCSAAVVVMQVADPSPADDLQVAPTAGFTAVSQRSLPPNPTSTTLLLTNTGAASVNWSLANTCLWLTVSSGSGTLPAASFTNVTVNLAPTATTNLAAGRYIAAVVLTNLASGAISTRLFTLVVSSGDAPIALTGYNAAILAPNTATSGAPKATPLDIPNNYCLYQAGLNGSTRGLPPDGVFTSQLDTNTVFQLQPYGSTNALMVGYNYPSSTTLTLATPRAYNSLSILAVSANGSGVGTLVLNFTNGTKSQPLNFNAQDWFAANTNIAIQGIGRLKLTTFGAEDNGTSNPHLYQTTLNLAALGIYQPIASITFTKPAGAGAQQDTAVFAVSGSVMPDAPLIIQQPSSVTNLVPVASATFNVVASGLPSLGYQWYFSTSGIAGSFAPLASANTNSLLLNPVLQASNVGSYFVVVTNSLGAVTSSVATLAVYRAPTITQQPTPTNVFRLMGGSNFWSVAANAATPVTYRWYKNGILIPTALNPTFQLTNLQLTNAGNYMVVISNAFGVGTSSVVSLTVVPINYPLSQMVLVDRPLAYWRLDETNGTVARDYAGGNNGTYSQALLGQTGNKLVDTHTAVRFGSLAANNSCVTNITVNLGAPLSANFSVEAWVNGGAQTTDAGLVTKGYGSGGEQFNLDCGGTSHGFRFFVRDGSGTARVASSSVLPNNQWCHVVGVCDQSNGYVRLYVDGVIVAQGTNIPNVGILSSTASVSIGSRQSGAGTSFNNQFVGLMEEVAIYGYALSSNQVLAHFLTATNRAPIFFSNPFTASNANAGQLYSATMATNASDPNGDAITFSKISGPPWLNVANNGSLSGTPFSPDVGPNSFTVRAADSGGLFNTATMNVVILPASPIVLSAVWQGTNLLLNWTGGIAPYQVVLSTNLTPPIWQNLGAPVGVNSMSVPLEGGTGFYQVYGR